MKNLILIPLVLFIIFNSCTSTPKRKQVKPTDAPILTQEEAAHRAEKVSQVSYDLYFDLSKKDKSYAGTSKINFALSDNSTDLRIDFYGGKVYSLKVNQKLVAPNYNKHYLLVARKDLLQGNNTIEIDFQQDFSRDGSGFYRFVDNEDKRIYTYTDLEPFDANKVFPCFDQPNLKATYTMRVLAPKEWQVITSTLPTKTTKAKQNKVWEFPKSAYFSTYIWSLHAGPYYAFTDKAAKYPSRVFTRQSMKKYIKIKDWFTFTRQGFEFLDEYFGYPYPYKKYDQIIVPDFNAGAMENVAAVTFSERYLSRGVKTLAKRRRTANVIFHEMAHMWFGNLVTMNWWNDLWLNESFATYIANLGLSRNTEFRNTAWPAFNGTKRWAYWEDQLVTTHPIEATVPDTSQAFANFDGITYGKGAASLKQIHYKLGDANFKKGLQIYFKRHANTNTVLTDFIRALEDGSHQILGYWQEKWLQTTGINTIATKFTCDNDKISSFEVQQSAPEGSEQTRPHSFKIALLNKQGGKFKVSQTHKVNLNTPDMSIPELVGKKCPEMVYPNFEDHDYLMAKLDTQTLTKLQKNINNISDDFLRQLFWVSLWDMVYYGQFSYQKYAKLVVESLPQEKNFIIMDNLLSSIYGRHSNAPSIQYYSAFDPNTTKKQKQSLTKTYEELIWKILQKAKGGSERQKILYNGYVATASTQAGLTRLHKLLQGKIKLRSFKVDQDKRWSIIVKLNSHNYPGANKLAQREGKKDKSSLGKKRMIAANAATPKWENKKKWISEFLKLKSEYSYSQLKTALYNLFPRHQVEFRRKYAKDFFKDMKWANKNKDTHVASKFAVLTPSFCSDESAQELSDFLASEELIPGVLKKLRITQQENQRCKITLERAKQ